MKDKEVTSTIISAQNQLLVLGSAKAKIVQQLADIKDLMRKMRQKEVKFTQATYCFNNGVALKKKSKEIYPLLQQKCSQLTKLKGQYNQKMNKEIKVLIDLMRNKKLVGGQLDLRVNNLLKEYESNMEQD